MEEKLPIDELEALAEVDVGQALRQTRLYYGRTLSDIEKALRIRSCQIDAIESGDISKLPGRVYAIGFVRSYAEHLGVDGDRVVQLFKAQYMDGQTKSVLSFPFPASETKTPALWLVIVSLFALILLFVFWYRGEAKPHSDVVAIEAVPEEITAHVNDDILSTTVSVSAPPQDPVMVEQVDVPAVENMAEGNNAPQIGIILNISDDSWVEIKNGKGEIIVSKILEKGDQYFVPDSPGLSMSLGNAANVEIVVDGKSLMPLGQDGDVRRDIPLNTAYLKTLAFKEDPPPVDTNDSMSVQ